jgi:hypothetical protein
MYPECTAGDHLFGSRSDLLSHEETSHRRVWKCRDHPIVPYKAESDFRAHLLKTHQSIDEETVEALVEFSSTAVDDDRQHCPLCLRRTESIAQGQTLFKHIANHLETLATFSLPRNVDLKNDNEKGGSNEPVQADDDDERFWNSDVSSEWSDAEEVAGADGVKMSLEHFPRHEVDSLDVVNEFLNTMQLSHPGDPGNALSDSPGLTDSSIAQDMRSMSEEVELEIIRSDALYKAAKTIGRHWQRNLRKRREQPSASSAVLGKLAATTTLPKFLNLSESGKS